MPVYRTNLYNKVVTSALVGSARLRHPDETPPAYYILSDLIKEDEHIRMRSASPATNALYLCGNGLLDIGPGTFDSRRFNFSFPVYAKKLELITDLSLYVRGGMYYDSCASRYIIASEVYNIQPNNVFAEWYFNIALDALRNDGVFVLACTERFNRAGRALFPELDIDKFIENLFYRDDLSVTVMDDGIYALRKV